MPKYEILAREIVYYAFEVEADNEEQAMQERKLWCVAPMHKSNYQLITNPADLKAINPKYNNANTAEYTSAMDNLGDAPW